MNDKPNLIERMENLIAALNDANLVASDTLTNPVDIAKVCGEIDNASGIAGEILTMIDGR